jgi:tetratricopeptide (TPR) repeat protein
LDPDVRHLHEELALQRFDRARHLVERVQTEDRQKALLLQAEILFAKGRANRALETLLKLEEAGFTPPEWHACRARIHLAWGHPEGAVDAARQAFEAEDDADYRLLLAKALAAAGREAEAIALLEASPCTANAETCLLKGDLYDHAGDGARAHNAWLSAFQRAPFNAEPLRRIARRSLATGELEAGATMLEELATISDLAGPEAFALAARLVLLLGDVARLRRLIEARLTRDDADADDLLWAARLMLAADERADATALLERAARLGLSPEQTATLRLQEGVARWIDGRHDDAVALLERALQGADDPAPALLNLAFLLLSRPKTPPAGLVRSLLERARAVGANEADVAVHEVLGLLNEGRIEQARDRFRVLVAKGLVVPGRRNA